MEQKRAMLYLDLEDRDITQQNIAAASIGLPIELPPPYDIAITASPQPLRQHYNNKIIQPTENIAITPNATTSAFNTHMGITTTPPQQLGPNPCAVFCPACGAQKTTRMTYTPDTRTHIGAALLCFFGCCCCACFMPYCMNSCRTGNHYCSKCNAFLGTYTSRSIFKKK